MTIGVSKERLEKIYNMYRKDLQFEAILGNLIRECRELNPWKPIEQAPKDRRIRLYYPASKNGEYERLVIERQYTDYFKLHSERLPTHWQELPGDPE